MLFYLLAVQACLPPAINCENQWSDQEMDVTVWGRSRSRFLEIHFPRHPTYSLDIDLVRMQGGPIPEFPAYLQKGEDFKGMQDHVGVPFLVDENRRGLHTVTVVAESLWCEDPLVLDKVIGLE